VVDAILENIAAGSVAAIESGKRRFFRAGCRFSAGRHARAARWGLAFDRNAAALHRDLENRKTKGSVVGARLHRGKRRLCVVDCGRPAGSGAAIKNRVMLASLASKTGRLAVDVDRRSVLGIAMVMASASDATPQSSADAIALWPAAPPGGLASTAPEKVNSKGSITNVSRPRLNVYQPARSNGAAILVIAGGGYAHIEAGAESAPACQWLQASGVTAFELIYRLPEDGQPPLAPFQDGQRAMRLIRATAANYGVDPARIGVIGFSAGGHLAGMTAVRPDRPLYPHTDSIDEVSARPDFVGLIYPVLTMMPPFDQTHARREILGMRPTSAENEDYSVERHVGERAPPMFLAQAADDPISPLDNSLMMFAALRAARAPGELHVFQTGGHGWGMGRPESEVHVWPELFAAWARSNNFLPTQPPR
jgi:acetyl esterase/lipase